MALYAFDGTWNEFHDTGVYGVNTNVVEFARAYDGRLAVVQQEKEGESSVSDDFYLQGPGTRRGRLGKFIGGAFGAGGRRRINEARDAVAEHFAKGDEKIDIVGFSRGAALALHFANTLDGKSFANKAGNKVPAVVRFLGLWDIVAAFGIPINLGPLHFQRINLGYKLRLSDRMQHCFHAVALDEGRAAFRVTRVDNGYQVWFRGVHSDIGGGNENPKLSNISLRWMLRKALAVGLPVDKTLADRLDTDTTAAVKPARKTDRPVFREISAKDRIHYTVSPRAVPECQVTPEGCAIESPEDESTRIPTVAELK